MPAKPATLPDDQAQLLVELGERLRKARLRRRLSAAEVALRAGITRVTLHRAEGGEPAITIGNIVKVLAALGLDDDLGQLARDQRMSRMVHDASLPARRSARKGRRIAVDEYPQLKQIAWHMAPGQDLSADEALALYERNWRHIDHEAMDTRERALLEQLTATVGHGVLLV
jgi:transcriptional regulator with XRE-family HTH domain